MRIRPHIAIAAGALLVSTMALLAASSAGGFVAKLEKATDQTIREIGARDISAHFATQGGWPSRHPILTDDGSNDDAARVKVAQAVSEIPGVGGVSWADGSMFVGASKGRVLSPLHCQEDVESLLEARSIRFEESSAAIEEASRELVDEVADALQPCLGAIIQISGHTDSSGVEEDNRILSRERAQAVRNALRRRGIPADGLRVQGLGSSEPVEGLDPGDPANRRIEFSVLRVEPLAPTPVDTPRPR